jgi:hypothetical protein
MRLVNAALVRTILLFTATFAQAQEKSLQVDAYVKAEMERSHIPGVAIAVLRNGKIELIKGYGVQNIDRKLPVKHDTMFQIASLTKPFTAMAGEQSGYGFGWFLTSYKGHRLLTHGGTLSGFSSVINRFVDDGITILVLNNSKAGADRIGYAEVLGRGLADLYLPPT